MTEDLLRLMEDVKSARDFLTGPHVYDNKFRMGAIGASDIEMAIILLDSIEIRLANIIGVDDV